MMGVYEVSSTGQFIPLVLGLLGLLKALLLTFISHSGAFRKVDITKVTTLQG